MADHVVGRTHSSEMKGHEGFTILEILIVITVIATLVAMAVPVMLRAKMAANETSCIASLRTVITQEALFARLGEVDQDGDDKGEYAWLSELSSEVCARKDPGAPNPFPPDPPFLTPALRTGASEGNGIAKKSGYFYRMYLAVSVPIGDAEDAGDDRIQDGTTSAWATPLDPMTHQTAIDLQENNFVCQAWPAVGHHSGQRCFVITAAGDIYASRMGMQSYSGETAQMADYSLCHSSNGDGSDGWWNDRLAAGRTDHANDGNIYNPTQ